MPDATPVRHYTRVPLEVAAVRWDGSNVEEMTALLGSHFDTYDDDAGVLTSKYSSWVPLDPGDWVVLGPGGSVSVMDADDFAATFVEADRD